MEEFGEITEMTSEEAKNIDTSKIEYISLTSGKIIYIKNKDEQNKQKEEGEKDNKEESLKEVNGQNQEKIEDNNLNEKDEKNIELKNEVKEDINKEEEKKELNNINEEKSKVNEKKEEVKKTEEEMKQKVRQNLIEKGKIKKLLNENRQKQTQLVNRIIQQNKLIKIRPMFLHLDYDRLTLKKKNLSQTVKVQPRYLNNLTNEEEYYDQEHLNDDNYKNQLTQTYNPQVYKQLLEKKNIYLKKQPMTNINELRLRARPMFKVLNPGNKK